MSEQVGNSVKDEISEIREGNFKFEITERSAVGVSESYTESYGDIVFKCEEGYNGFPRYSFEFNEEAQVSILHKNSKESDKFIYILEALSREVSVDDALKVIYKDGTQKIEDVDTVLNQDNTLKQEYREDLSRLLEEEFWEEEEEGEEYGFQVS